MRLKQALFLFALGFTSLAAKSPNVLFLFTDDQRQGTIKAWGNPDIQTPNIDRLVESGVSFRNAYIMGGSSPGVCLPSRASLLTGRTLWNIECQGIWGYEISEQYKTLPEVFRESGYTTFATGKNDPGKSGQFGRAYSEGANQSAAKFNLCSANSGKSTLFCPAPDRTGIRNTRKRDFVKKP